MKIEKKRIMRNVYVVHFDSQKNMAETFLRFQEHYESPKFRNKIFTHKEFREWYIQNSKEGKKTGKFTYYKDWDGFNIPSNVLNPFKEGKFNPLTEKEKKLLCLFKNVKGKFYIIAYHGGGHHLLGHELAHALFHTNEIYKNKVLKVLKRYNLKKVEKELLSIGGYGKHILKDEIQAYAVSLNHELMTDIPKQLMKEVNDIFGIHSPRIK
jgi:hypothetical protein